MWKKYENSLNIMTFTPSSEQLAIREEMATGKRNVIIKARAGTGKTSTMIWALPSAPERNIFYGQFNRKNADEVGLKLKGCQNVTVNTWHGMGNRFIKQVWGGVRPDDEVEAFRVDSIGKFSYEERAIILKLVGFSKNTFISPSQEDMENLCDERDIEYWAIPHCLKVLEVSKVKDARNRISFNDMVWLPCALNIVNPIYDMVIGDEFQDLNFPQLTMCRAASKGRVMGIGDDRQMIYSFRGCHPDGMGMMKATLRAHELKLTQTFRCAKSIVRVANEIVPEYYAHESNPEGEVNTVQNAMDAVPGDAILSRLNAPLMGTALALLRKNIPARIEGRDIGKQLCNMIRGFKAKSCPNFFEKVDAWFAKQELRFSKTKNAAKILETSKDMADTLKAVAEGCKNVDEIFTRINNLFEDTNSGSRPAVILSSVHKAKGLEWNKVYMLSHTFRKGKTVEESNIWYVCVTRARNSLNFVNSEHTESKQIKEHKAVTTAELIGV